MYVKPLHVGHHCERDDGTRKLALWVLKRQAAGHTHCLTSVPMGPNSRN
jgi:hypothetical protein